MVCMERLRQTLIRKYVGSKAVPKLWLQGRKFDRRLNNRFGSNISTVFDIDAAVRFGILGDVEPKPNPEFGNLRHAVELLNDLHEDFPLDFVAGIGDIPHKAKESHYEIATSILKELEPEFYPIVGNEEMERDTEYFIEFKNEISPGAQCEPFRYSLVKGGMVFLFVSAISDGVNFSNEELNWIQSQLDHHSELPAVCFAHAAPHQSWPKTQDIKTANRFQQTVNGARLVTVFSGHSHLNIDSYNTVLWDQRGINHVHVPGIERTKYGDTHRPRIRVCAVHPTGLLEIRTYNLRKGIEEKSHRHRLIFE